MWMVPAGAITCNGPGVQGILREQLLEESIPYNNQLYRKMQDDVHDKSFPVKAPYKAYGGRY